MTFGCVLGGLRNWLITSYTRFDSWTADFALLFRSLVMLLHSVANHPWVGKLLMDYNKAPRKHFFLGIIQEVSDSGKYEEVYVQYMYNDGEVDYCYVPRTAQVVEGSVRFGRV